MTVKIHAGDCRDVLKGMMAGSVHTCITSPPYYGQRDYGIEPVVWGGDANCDHVWGEQHTQHQRGKVGNNSTLDGGPQSGGDEGRVQNVSTGQFCQLCGAWNGCLGNEPDPAMYVAHLVEVAREIRRVLRDDGNFFLNLGDSYASGNNAQPQMYYRLRSDLTPKQQAYVLSELAKASLILEDTQEGLE